MKIIKDCYSEKRSDMDSYYNPPEREPHEAYLSLNRYGFDVKVLYKDGEEGRTMSLFFGHDELEELFHIMAKKAEIEIRGECVCVSCGREHEDGRRN